MGIKEKHLPPKESLTEELAAKIVGRIILKKGKMHLVGEGGGDLAVLAQGDDGEQVSVTIAVTIKLSPPQPQLSDVSLAQNMYETFPPIETFTVDILKASGAVTFWNDILFQKYQISTSSSAIADILTVLFTVVSLIVTVIVGGVVSTTSTLKLSNRCVLQSLPSPVKVPIPIPAFPAEEWLSSETVSISTPSSKTEIVVPIQLNEITEPSAIPVAPASITEGVPPTHSYKSASAVCHLKA